MLVYTYVVCDAHMWYVSCVYPYTYMMGKSRFTDPCVENNTIISNNMRIKSV